MISIRRIVEQQGYEGQYYDLGKDFANFRRTIDGANEEVKKRFEQAINSRLAGKRILARASRGYKQYVKDYEFDVVKITLDDYYDNYVVVAHDNTTPKAKEYFLKPGFKIQVLGAATGQPSPQKGDKPGDEKPQVQQPSPNPLQPKQDPTAAQHQPMSQAPAGNTPSEQPMRESGKEKYVDIYSVDQISKDIEQWLPWLLIKPKTAMRDFVKGQGVIKNLGRGTDIAIFEVKIPKESLVTEIDSNRIANVLRLISKQGSTIDTTYNLKRMEFDETREEWRLRITKTMTDKSAIV